MGNGTTAGASAADLATVQALLAGDEAAFNRLLDQHHGAMVRLAQVFVRDRAIAEEVAQETWLAVLDGLANFQGRSSLKSWIYSIVTNRARTRGVREGRTVPFSALGEPDDDGPAVDPSRFRANGHWASSPAAWDSDTPDLILERRALRDQLQGAIASLPNQQRLVLTLRDIDGLDAQEVCNILDIAETHMRVLLHRARSKVRAVIERQLGEV